MPLNQSEVEFALAIQEEARKLLHPVPFLLIFPSSLHRKNVEAMGVFIDEKMNDREFLIEVVKTGVNPDHIVDIMMGATGFETMKRSLLMRLQWFLQIIVLIIIWVMI
jgi:hypothetical protein